MMVLDSIIALHVADTRQLGIAGTHLYLALKQLNI
jgi:hypothetical protein